MYRLIEKHAATVVGTIQRSFVSDYEWLLENQDKVSGDEYRGKYRNFWGMNAARLSDDYLNAYFSALQDVLENSQNQPTLTDVVKTLLPFSKSRKGNDVIQFSFATKLLHMANTALPVYDSRVVGFYFFREPTRTKKRGGVEGQLADYLDLHDFLIYEYDRVLREGILSKSIQEFEKQLSPRFLSKQKIIDSLIWGFVSSGAVQRKKIQYE